MFAPAAIGYDHNGHPVTDFSHTINDFTLDLDKIDLRQFSDVSSIDDLSFTPQSGDTLVSWSHEIGQRDGEPVLEQEQILLKSVTANLKASDFIFHVN